MRLERELGRLPTETPDYWLCCCTAYNAAATACCRRCGQSLMTQKAALNPDYLAHQNAQWAEQEQKAMQAHERAQETENKKLQKITRLLLAFISCAAAVLILFNATAKQRRYRAAERLYENGSYVEAIDAFYAIGKDYKDVDERLNQALYAYGISLYNDNRYHEAVATLSSLDAGYDDTDVYLNRCYDMLGQAYCADDDFVSAYVQFSQITAPTAQIKRAMQDCIAKGYDRAVEAYEKDGVIPDPLDLSIFDGYKDVELYRVILYALRVKRDASPGALSIAYNALKHLDNFGHADKLRQDEKYTWWLLNNHRFENADGYYFEMKDKIISFNIPDESIYTFDNQVTYNIEGIVYYHILTDQGPQAGFRFDMNDPATLSLYCFKDQSVYTLPRQY